MTHTKIWLVALNEDDLNTSEERVNEFTKDKVVLGIHITAASSDPGGDHYNPVIMVVYAAE